MLIRIASDGQIQDRSFHAPLEGLGSTRFVSCNVTHGCGFVVLALLSFFFWKDHNKTFHILSRSNGMAHEDVI